MFILQSISTKIYRGDEHSSGLETCLCMCEFKHGNETIIGIGQTGSKDVDIVEELLHRRVAPAVLGTPLTFTIDRIRQRVGKTVLAPLMELVLSFELNYKMMGVQLCKAVCAVDACVWDALGKLHKQPVWKVMLSSMGEASRQPPALHVYASSIAREVDLTTMKKELLRLHHQHGITSFKLKLGERMGGTLRNLGLKNKTTPPQQNPNTMLNDLQHSLPNCRFAFDCNGGFVDDDDLMANAPTSFLSNIWFLEEPFPWFMMRRPMNHIGNVPIAGGEQEFRADVLEQAIKMKLFDIMQADVGYCGGATVALLLSRFASRYGVSFMPHSPTGDLIPIMAAHVLMTMRDDDGVVIELGCVNDGLRQVALDPNTGEYWPKFCTKQSGWKVTNGVMELSRTLTVGWGIEFAPNLTMASGWRTSDLSNVGNVNRKRSGL